MGCPGGCGKSIGHRIQENVIKPVKNLIDVSKQQKSVVKWFRDGATGLLKCMDGDTKYPDSQIKENRQKCAECEYSTKVDGKIVQSSQCMAPDPENDNAPCGCFIICKTQVDKCPIGKFAYITLERKTL